MKTCAPLGRFATGCKEAVEQSERLGHVQQKSGFHQKLEQPVGQVGVQQQPMQTQWQALYVMMD